MASTARTLAPCLALALAASGCDESAKPAGAASSDCSTVLRRTSAPRIVAVLDDGTLAPGPACATANCLAGADGVFAWRGDGDVVHVSVGARSLDLPIKRHSPLSATASLPGLAVADGTVTLDRGATVEVVTADATASAPMPALLPRAKLAPARLVEGGGIESSVSGGGEACRQVALTPFLHKPADASWPVRDRTSGAQLGWLAPGADAAVVALDGTRTPLHVALDDTASVTKLGDAWVVSAGERAFLLRHGASVDVPHGMNLSTSSHGPFGVRCGTPFTIDTLAHADNDASLADAWRPAFGGADHDLAGTPLPAGSSIERLAAAVHGARVLAIERVKNELCTIDDRVFLVDVDAHTVKRVDRASDTAKLHPVWAGDRFRYVEADVDLSQP